MKTFLKSLYLDNRFFFVLLAVAGLFMLSFFFEAMFVAVWWLFCGFLLAFVFDVLLLFGQKGIFAERFLPEKFSNSDENPVQISLENRYFFSAHLLVIDELPFQFQIRDFQYSLWLKKNEEKSFQYNLRPTERGVYGFGALNVFVRSPLGLAQRRYVFSQKASVAVFPSFLQMKAYEMRAFSKHLFQFGFKKIPKLGHTMEFDNIKEYVLGNDIRSINWKSSSKQAKLMVNQYQDEKSQPVYMLIDKGHSMQMPFEGLTLLDYAINTSLALSNIVIKKQDKAGVMTFNKNIEYFVKAQRSASQMFRINQALYSIKTDFEQSDFSRLYSELKIQVKQRSLLMLFTNFETLNSLERQLPYLKTIAKKHLLVVVFFQNTELIQLAEKKSDSLEKIYNKAIAEQFIFDKNLIRQQLVKNGIHCVLCPPQDLTLQSINKYLELKARRLI